MLVTDFFFFLLSVATFGRIDSGEALSALPSDIWLGLVEMVSALLISLGFDPSVGISEQPFDLLVSTAIAAFVVHVAMKRLFSCCRQWKARLRASRFARARKAASPLSRRAFAGPKLGVAAVNATTRGNMS